MRRSSRKKPTKKLPIIVATILVVGFTAVLVPLTRAWFSSERQPVGSVDEHTGIRPGAAFNKSRHRNIYDHGYRELAVSFMMKSLYARPLEIKDIDGVAGMVADDLGLDAAQLGRSLKAERSFLWLGRRLPGSKADAVLHRGVAGIFAEEEPQRFYPARRSGAHVVGFVEEDNGLAGVEFTYDNILHHGSAGKDGEGMGGHLQLTMDLRAQELLTDKLGALISETGAESGAGIVMNYKTGAVLAMVSLPDYDPNSYWEADRNGRLNRAVNGSLELGGFSSLFGLAAAYETGSEENGKSLVSVKMDLLIANLLKEKRLAKLYERRGDEVLSAEFGVWREKVPAGKEGADLAERMGLFRKSGIDLPETGVSYDARSAKTTPLNLLTAFAALVNGGHGITPHLGEAVIDPDSGLRKVVEHPERTEKMLRARTSRKIVELLSEASGAGPKARFLESMRAVAPMVGAGEVGKQSTEELKPRYQTVMVGFTPKRQAGLAILVTLDRASVDYMKKTVMRRMGEGTLQQMAKLADERQEPPSHEAMAASEKRIFEAWLGSRAINLKVMKLADEKQEIVRPDVMPDLCGLSLRKALRVLQPFGVMVEVVGSGRVAEQVPKAGVPFNGGECRLALLDD